MPDRPFSKLCVKKPECLLTDGGSSEADVDESRVRLAQRKIELGLMDQADVVDSAVEQLLELFLAGDLDLVTRHGKRV